MVQMRKAASLTQDEMAHRLGVTRVAYQHYERGRCAPKNIEAWGIIADTFGISISSVLALENARAKSA